MLPANLLAAYAMHLRRIDGSGLSLLSAQRHVRARPTCQEVQGIEDDVLVLWVCLAQLLKVGRHLLTSDPGCHRVLDDCVEPEDQLGMGGWSFEGFALSLE